MIGCVNINNLEVACVVEVYPRERVQKQTLWLDLSLYCDFAKASRMDAVNETVDYDPLVSDAVEFARAGRLRIVETCAEAVAAHVLARYSSIERLFLRLRKPQALERAGVEVCVERVRDPRAKDHG